MHTGSIVCQWGRDLYIHSPWLHKLFMFILQTQCGSAPFSDSVCYCLFKDTLGSRSSRLSICYPSWTLGIYSWKSLSGRDNEWSYLAPSLRGLQDKNQSYLNGGVRWALILHWDLSWLVPTLSKLRDALNIPLRLGLSMVTPYRALNRTRCFLSCIVLVSEHILNNSHDNNEWHLHYIFLFCCKDG